MTLIEIKMVSFIINLGVAYNTKKNCTEHIPYIALNACNAVYFYIRLQKILHSS